GIPLFSDKETLSQEDLPAFARPIFRGLFGEEPLETVDLRILRAPERGEEFGIPKEFEGSEMISMDAKNKGKHITVKYISLK
ncbi:hypothetical protein IIB49_02880, partial [Patescibacteria group bacterium]|nr:hypothetical protein [Patescibacteria group bacterium]